MDQDAIPGVNFNDNTNQRTPCVLLIDCSYSMANQMKAVNSGLRDLEEALKADSVARERVSLLTIRFGGSQAQIAEDWTDAISYSAPLLEADGGTPLASGLLVALDKINEVKEEIRQAGLQYSRPLIYLITDGAPTDAPDAVEQATSAINAAISGKHVQLFSIGVDGADMEVLQSLGGPVLKLEGTNWKELFQFISGSVSSASSAAAGSGAQQVPLPASVTIHS